LYKTRLETKHIQTDKRIARMYMIIQFVSMFNDVDCMDINEV